MPVFHFLAGGTFNCICMKNIVRHLVSLILPFTVVVVIPFMIEQHGRMVFGFFSSAGILCILSGLFVLIRSILNFANPGKGTLAPWSPPRHLVVSGFYRYVRNPMILAVVAILAGEAILLHSRNIALWAFIFFIINHLFFVLYEEPCLERRFGERYLEYKKHVGRWWPKIKPYKPEY